MSRNTATHLRLINGWIPYIWLSSVHCLQLEILQARAPSNFCKWLVSWKGLRGGLQLAYVLSPTSFQTLKWKFSTFGPVCNPGALPGWKEKEISSEFSPSNPGWCADGKGQAGSHPVPYSPSYFHWVHLFWLQFSPHPGVTIFPGERKMQDSAGWSHCPRYWESGSVAWPLLFLRHLNYSYSIRHIWRKEIGLSQVADVSAGMYGWKLILWHRLMKPAVSRNTDIYLYIFFTTQDLCHMFSLVQTAIDILTMTPGIFRFHKPCLRQSVKISRNW